MIDQGKKNMIENIVFNGTKYATIIRADHKGEGIEFITDSSYSQQVAFMHHPKNKNIDAHYHNKVERSVVYTQEVLVIRKGVLRVDFYDDDNAYIASTVLREGDVILLIAGGHGFKTLEELEMIEVKQGPYIGDADKTRFGSVRDEDVRIMDTCTE